VVAFAVTEVPVPDVGVTHPGSLLVLPKSTCPFVAAAVELTADDPSPRSTPCVVLPDKAMLVTVGVELNEGAADVFPIKTCPFAPADVTPIADVAFPYSTPSAVKVTAPVPPLVISIGIFESIELFVGIYA
jgi:hypothetical protein